MKKKVIIAVTAGIILCFLSACAKKQKESEADVHKRQDAVQKEQSAEETTAMDATASTASTATPENAEDVERYNRSMIAEALGTDEEERSIRFILATLDTFQAGEIKSIEKGEDGTLQVTAEDGTPYKLYLTENGSVEAVENLETGEWPVTSEK